MNAINGFFELSLPKQVFLLLALSGSIALGIYIAMWTKTPDYAPLFAQLNNKESGEVVDALQRINYKYRIDERTGLILVDASKIQDARIKLASQGVPSNSATGIDLLEKDSVFGSSQLVERARYVRALEGELEKTISSIENIKSARVHLGIPNQSSLIKDKKEPPSSVLIDILVGYRLENDQIAAITHLVASSVQGLQAQHVTVIDQNGKLLSSSGSDSLSAAAKQLDYTQKLERGYSQRIYELLAPMFGYDSVKAEVTALLDFTSYEETSENYDPSKKAIRSEKITDIQKTAESVGGVPGAQSNQPGAKPQDQQSKEPAKDAPLVNSNKNEVRNYELDRQIKHQSNLPGKVIKLSVAVVVDDKTTYDQTGKATKTPLTPDEIKKIESLVKDAIGYDEKRGDRVSILNSRFAESAPIQELPKPNLLEKAWFTSLTKQLMGGVLFLVLILLVLRPIFKSLVNVASIKESFARQNAHEDHSAIFDSKGKKLAHDEYHIRVKEVINEDPKKAAQVVKNWIGVENEKR